MTNGLTVREACAILGVCPATLRKVIKRGEVATYTVNKIVRIKETEVLRIQKGVACK